MNSLDPASVALKFGFLAVMYLFLLWVARSARARTLLPLLRTTLLVVLLALSPVGRRLLVPPAGGTIGRSRDCDLVLDDTGISRRHAEIRLGPDGWEIEDLGSTNGVLVNGQAIRSRQLLAAGDRVELGSTEARFELG